MKKQKIQIKTYWGSMLWESEKETIKEAVIEKYLKDANLEGANLQNTNLQNANLRNAYLRNAYLQDANLQNTNLEGADLRNANLQNTNLQGAYLEGANLQNANLRNANLRNAYLQDANLEGADLQGANLWQLPKDYINQCSRDILFILGILKKEVPFLKEKLLKGEVDGTQYEGSCACLIGSLANADGGMDAVCKILPFYEKGLQNMGEQWFWNIKEGDTPDTNQFSAHAVKLCEMVETGNYYTIEYNPTKEDIEKWEKKREKLRNG